MNRLNSLLKNLNSVSFLLPLALLVVGLYLFPIKFFETNFSKIPGDVGDARFNNYVLEHGYKYFSGKINNYWDAPFMYPFKNVIAMSDNLLGTLPVYSVFRSLGIDRETSFQFWIMALFSLNYIFCFLALNRWSKHLVLSSVGAYVFAFSIFNVGQLGHVQILPRFIIPFIFYWCWKYFSEKRIKYFLFTLLGIVYLFYCGIYLGFLTIYILLFFLISHFIIYRDWTMFLQFKNLKTLGSHMTIIILCALLLMPLMVPYIKISHITGTRHFEDALNTIPQLRSYFFTSPASVIWGNILYKHSAYSFPFWWNHFLFIGAVPWFGVLAIPIIIFSKQVGTNKKRFILFLSLVLFLSLIFSLNIKGFSLFQFIYKLPGFSSMRSIDRIINTEVICFILVFVFVFRELYNTYNKIKWIVLAFPLLIVVDNLIVPENHKRFDKYKSQIKINSVREKIKNQYDNHYAAIAFMPVTVPATNNEDLNGWLVENTLDVMLAAQELNIPCVNGYTGFNPGNYIDFFNNPEDESLYSWLTYSKGNINTIQRVNEIGKREKSRTTIYLKAFNGKYVCADEGLNNMVAANKEKPSTWETFTLIIFDNNECAIRSFKNLFLSADSGHQNEITATKTKVDSWETFTIINLDSNHVAFKAANGKYLSVDEKSLQLFAGADSVGHSENFQLIQNTK